MKLRSPEGEPRRLDIQQPTTDACVKKTFAVEVITPIYGGGVVAGHPDEEMPIRASAIRGQLRFWWRLLNRGRFAGDSRALFRAERDIWGAMGDGDTPNSSRVFLQVSKVVSMKHEACASYGKKGDGTWRTTPNFSHGPGYVLFPGQGKAEKNKGVTERPRDILLADLEFDVTIGFRGVGGPKITELWEREIFPVLRWWASFGGIGARTRRGMGSVKVEGLPSVSPKEAETIGCVLKEMREHGSDGTKIWNKALNKLQHFRQGLDFGRNPGDGKTPGPSRWPEADSIREITGCFLQDGKTHTPRHAARLAFPRAAFGLPIITHFKDGSGDKTPVQKVPKLDPGDTTLVPLWRGEAQDRLASPLILKAMWNGKDYTPIALRLPVDHVDAMGLKLKGAAPNLPRDFAPGTWWSPPARTAMTAGNQPNPLHGGTGDVLRDFLAYFGGDHV